MINGFIVVNKEKGMTSAKVVGKVKHLLYSLDKHQKLGHLGTLDPDGEGVLPIALGRATRLFDFLLNKQKTYYTIFKFGVLTDTLDSSGKIVAESNFIPDLEEVKIACKNMCGKCMQIPPQYSARNYDGARAYDLARSGIIVDLPPKEIEIFDISDIAEIEKGMYELKITCSSGTYIRSIARDLGVKLGTYATMEYIRRIKSGAFDISDAHTLDELEKNIVSSVLPMDFVLKDVPMQTVTRQEELHLLKGFSIKTANSDSDFVKIYCLEELIGIGTVSNNELKVKSWLKSRALRENAEMVLALGFFDGIHLGHKRILDVAKECAKDEGSIYATLFSDNISNFTKKDNKFLFTYEERKALLEKNGVIPYRLSDKAEFYECLKDEFLSLILEEIAPNTIVVGENFRFGKDRQGDVSYLIKWGEEHGVRIVVESLVTADCGIVSTTTIKQLLAEGKIDRAQKLLDTPYYIEGYSIKCRGEGKKLGFPTLNIEVSKNKALPKYGVYAARAFVDGIEYKGVTNIGNAPTFQNDRILVETHLIETEISDNLHKIKVIPLKYLREITSFDTKKDLIMQIEKDIAEAKND